MGSAFRLDLNLITRLICECVGTFLYVLSIQLVVVSGSSYAGLGIGVTLMLVIYIMGPISGGHVNPAVTLAITLIRKMDGGIFAAILYILVQIIGGILGAVAGGLISEKEFRFFPQTIFEGDPRELMIKSYAAGIMEFFYTALLVLAVLNTACAKVAAGNQYFGLAIGCTMIAGAFAIGGISGCGMNPAVTIGINTYYASVNPAPKMVGPTIPAPTSPVSEVGSTRVLQLEAENLGMQQVVEEETNIGLVTAIYLVFQFLGSCLAAGIWYLAQREDLGEEGKQKPLYSRVWAEFWGSFYFMLTIAFTVTLQSAEAAIGIAAVLITMVYSFGPVSGGHFNSAITFGVLLSERNKIIAKDVGFYCIAQFLGTFLAAAICLGITEQSVALPGNSVHSWGSVLFAEFFYTFFFVLTVLATATTEASNKDYFGLCIGFFMLVSVLTIGGISGSLINPNVSFAFQLVDTINRKGGAFEEVFAYQAIQLLAAFFAAVFFRVAYYAKEYKYATEVGSQEDPKDKE